MSSYFCCIDLQHWWTARTCRCRLIGRRCFYSRAFWIITPTSRSMCLSDGTTGLWAAGGLRTRFIWMCVSTVLENVKLALLFSYKLSWGFAECFDHFVFPASFSRLTESRWCFYFTRQVWIMSCLWEPVDLHVTRIFWGIVSVVFISVSCVHDLFDCLTGYLF